MCAPEPLSSGNWDSSAQLLDCETSYLSADECTHVLFGDGDALRAMFHPKTVAILGHKVLAALTMSRFEGSLVAVDSRPQDNAFGIRVYRGLEDVPDRVDLAVVATTRSDETLEAIEQCAGVGVRES